MSQQMVQNRFATVIKVDEFKIKKTRMGHAVSAGIRLTQSNLRAVAQP